MPTKKVQKVSKPDTESTSETKESAKNSEVATGKEAQTEYPENSYIVPLKTKTVDIEIRIINH